MTIEFIGGPINQVLEGKNLTEYIDPLLRLNLVPSDEFMEVDYSRFQKFDWTTKSVNTTHMEIQITFFNPKYISLDAPDLMKVTFKDTYWIASNKPDGMHLMKANSVTSFPLGK